MLCSALTMKLRGEMPDRRQLSQIHLADFTVFVSFLKKWVNWTCWYSWLFWWPTLCFSSFFFFFSSEGKEKRSRILYDTSFLHVIDELQEWLVLTSALEVCVFNREEV